MVFSDTSNKNGLIQDCEDRTGLGDAGISGDATQLKLFTSFLNAAYSELAPILYSYRAFLGWNDFNNSGTPTQTKNIVNGTNAYAFTTDANTNKILLISDVMILSTATATQYTEPLEQITAEDEDADSFISPNTLQTGVPSRVLIMGTTIYFDVIPNFSATNGIKVFISTEQSKFVSTDTTKEPGFPSPFHDLLSKRASRRWLAKNKDGNQTQIAELTGFITADEQGLRDFLRAEYPAVLRISPNADSNR